MRIKKNEDYSITSNNQEKYIIKYESRREISCDVAVMADDRVLFIPHIPVIKRPDVFACCTIEDLETILKRVKDKNAQS